MRSRLLAFLLVLAPTVPTLRAQSAPHVVLPLPDIKFAMDEDVKCLSYAVMSGDPDKGPSTFALKALPGCLVPWHTHTAQEQLIVVQGKLRTEMEGMSATTLGPGGFAFMLSKEKHQFTCTMASECVLFVMFDRIYDIQWMTARK